MYNDHSNTNRQTWKFTYTGSELLAPAEKKLAFFREKEKAARQKAASLLQDETVAHDDDEVTKARSQIANNGNNAEQCSVFVHEFERSPDRKFHLSLGDVVFFDLVNAVPLLDA